MDAARECTLGFFVILDLDLMWKDRSERSAFRLLFVL